MPGIDGEGAPQAAGATDPVASNPAADPAPATPEPAAPSPSPDPAPAAGAADPAAAAPAGSDKPANEFAPSLLDEAAQKPATDAPKPADAAPADGAAKPAGDQPPADKAPAAADGKPGDQAQPGADGQPAAPPAPIEYAFTMEGADGQRVALAADQVDPERMGAFTGLLNEVRVAPEAAQRFMDLHLAEMKRVADHLAEKQWEVFREQQRVAREEVMSHPVLGGSRHDTAMKDVMKAIDGWSNRRTDQPRSAEEVQAERKQLMDDFRATGIANRVSLLSLLHYFGENFFKEAQPHAAPPPRAPAPTGRDRSLSRYRNTTPA
jgi:hypothetical protein